MRKTTSVKLAITLLAMLGAACTPKAKDTNHNFQSPKGTNAGQVIFFMDDASQSTRNVTSLMLNHKFLAAMQHKKQFQQGLCAGKYVIEAKAIAPVMNKRNQVEHYKAIKEITVSAGVVKYVLVERKATAPFLSLKEVDKSVWEKQGKLSGANDRVLGSKLVHRLSENTMNCQNTTK